MAAIFPPASQGGVPPGPNVCNGYTPEHGVSGEGPLYVANDCTTTLTDCQMNALTSELLAAVDRLGFTYNSGSITNLADALTALFDSLSTGKVDISGDTMTGPLILAADPTVPLGAATKQYIDNSHLDIIGQLAGKVAKAGDTMTGPLTLPGPPSAALHAATRAYVDAGDTATQGMLAAKLDKAGGTMTGTLVLAGSPVANADAANKLYVDTQVTGATTGRFLPLTGGTLTGPLVLSGPPTAPLNPVTLQYFTDNMAAAGLYPDAPNDGKLYGRKSNGWTAGVQLAGDTMTGPLTLSTATPTGSLHAAPKQYVDTQVTANLGAKVNKAGDTMTGALVLAGNPGAALEAAPKQYVDTRVTRTGDTMTGTLNLNVATAAQAWSVNAGAAYVKGDGSALYSVALDVRGDPAFVRFYDSGGTIIRAQINPDAAGTRLNFTIGGTLQGYFTNAGVLHVNNKLEINNSDAYLLSEGPGGDLYLKATAQYYFRYNAGAIYWFGSSGGAYNFVITSAGDIGIRGANATKVGGGPWLDSSDARIKDRVRDYEHGLAEICQLQPVTYHFLEATERDPRQPHVGLVAQDAEPIMPELVTRQMMTLGKLQFDDMRVLDAGPLTFALINAVKELAAANDELRARIKALEEIV